MWVSVLLLRFEGVRYHDERNPPIYRIRLHRKLHTADHISTCEVPRGSHRLIIVKVILERLMVASPISFSLIKTLDPSLTYVIWATIQMLLWQSVIYRSMYWII